jgi:8-amino-7-oxononanoate synthase
MAEFLQRDRALLFSSGYLANIGLMSSLSHRHHVILSDKLCHASLLDGITLSRAKHLRYRHNDVNHAAILLKKLNAHSILVTESVFSMEGDISPVDQLAHLTKHHQSTLIVDDAHGVGVLGKYGRGICDYYHLSQEDIPCLITALGKSLGSIGAVISGKGILIDALIQFSNTYRYTTALPPALAYATIESLKVLQNELWRREVLQELIQFFIEEAHKRSLTIISKDVTPIKSILIGDNARALKIKEHLQHKGFFISCIRPPTVPSQTARLRISLNCLHTKQDISILLDTIAGCNEKYA